MSYKVKTRPHVLLKLDNTTAVAYINKKWGRFPSLVTSWRKTFVSAVKNTATDFRSRLCYNNKEWSLNESVAKSLFGQFRKPEIDLFAIRLNTKCTKYASYKPDPDAYVNVFSLSWLDLNTYICSIYNLV